MIHLRDVKKSYSRGEQSVLACAVDRLDIETLGDPDKLEKLLDRFAAMWDATNSQEQALSGVASLFGNGPQSGISEDLLLQIAQMKR